MKSNRPAQSSGRGVSAFTLAEGMIAVLVIGVMIISLYACFSTGLSILQQTRENLRATQILMQRMETVRLYTWSQINDTNTYFFPTFSEIYDPYGQTNNAGGTVYSGSLSVDTPTGLPAGYQNNVRVITVTVCWTNYSGSGPNAHSRQMQTYVARYGMQNHTFNVGP